jgi:hypothetical protein
MTDIAPPATAVWYDAAVTTGNVLAVLRLSDGDVDQARLEALIPAAAESIDAYLDGDTAVTGPPPPASVQAALEAEVVARYRSTGADPYIALGVTYMARGSLYGGEPVTTLLRPSRGRRGVA